MKFRKEDFYQYVNDIARDAAKERIKFNERNLGVTPNPEDEEKLARAYVNKLLSKYKYEDSDDFFNRFSNLKNTPSADLANWMMGGGEVNTFNEKYNPDNIAKKAELDKFMPLVAGVAKDGEDWLSQPGSVLRDLAANEYGYKRKEFPQFLEKLRDYQTLYDRAKLAEQAKEQIPAYGIRKLITPTAMQEFENAVATGGDYDVGTAAKLGGIDALVNSAMWLAPSASVVKNPIANGAIDALIQSAFEAGRQGAKQGLSSTGQEFDIKPVLLAGGAGLTKPGLVGLAQGYASKIGHPNANEFARGISKAVRTGDPVYNERRALENAIKKYNDNLAWWQNKLYKSEEKATKELAMDLFGKGMKDKFRPLNKAEEYIRLANVPKQAEILGVKPSNEGLYNVSEMMSAYDQPLGAVVRIGSKKVNIAPRDKVSEWAGNNTAGLTKSGTPYRVLYAKEADAFRNAFPAKYTDEASETGYSKAGRVFGELLADYGSRLEPTFKTAGDKLLLPKRTYKDEPWYRNLKEKYPDRAKIIDEAFKEKDKK